MKNDHRVFFFGTTSDLDFLKDLPGDRRWYPITPNPRFEVDWPKVAMLTAAMILNFGAWALIFMGASVLLP